MINNKIIVNAKTNTYPQFPYWDSKIIIYGNKFSYRKSFIPPKSFILELTIFAIFFLILIFTKDKIFSLFDYSMMLLFFLFFYLVHLIAIPIKIKQVAIDRKNLKMLFSPKFIGDIIVKYNNQKDFQYVLDYLINNHIEVFESEL